MSNTSSWWDMTKQGLRGCAKWMAEHGTLMGIGTAAATAVATVGLYQGAEVTQVPQIAEDLRAIGGAVLTAGLLKTAGWVGAEHICRTYLKDVNIEFDDAWRANTQRDLRGATPLPVDHELSDPTLQEAAKEVFRQMANNPETRSDVMKMIRENPNMRSLYANDSVDQEAQSLITPQTGPDDEIDDIPSPRM
ncbi:MAG: hypothetical protein AWU57_14 [Marinobacter sp. T13-3]|nr:MAG: hypothetical protein AWU57_14 [Marinobacter sp. T13-3]